MEIDATGRHAKLLQLHPTLPDPIDCSPPSSLCLWDSPGKNTGVGCHVFLQGIFSTQELKLCLLHCGWILYHSTTWESPYRSQPYLLWEGTTQRSGTGRQRLLGTILEAGYHKCVGPFIVPYSAPVILPTTFGR